MALFKLPRLQERTAIVDNAGKVVRFFSRYWDEFAKAIEQQVNDILAVQAAIQQAQQDILDVQAVQAAEIARLNAVVFANQQTSASAQAAAQAANFAQQTADEALANGTVSAYASDPSMSLAGTGWAPGPQVNLTSVLAGNLTISGTGPQQDLDVALTTLPGFFSGEFRIVEIDGMTETVVAGPFAFSATQNPGESAATVTNDALGSVETFSAALTTTGSLSYRLDARRVSGPNIDELYFYIYARRAP